MLFFFESAISVDVVYGSVVLFATFVCWCRRGFLVLYSLSKNVVVVDSNEVGQ